MVGVWPGAREGGVGVICGGTAPGGVPNGNIFVILFRASFELFRGSVCAALVHIDLNRDKTNLLELKK